VISLPSPDLDPDPPPAAETRTASPGSRRWIALLFATSAILLLCVAVALAAAIR